MSAFLPQLIFLAVGGSIAPPLLLLNILFLGSQSPLPNATALALGYLATCTAMGVVLLTVFSESAGAEGATTVVGRVISATKFGWRIRIADSRGALSKAITLSRQPPSLLRVMLFLAATIVVLAGMRLGAPIVTPTLFALVLSLIFSPVYSWLKRRGLPPPLALLVMLVGLGILFVALFVFLSVSIGKFTGRLAFYTTQLDIRTDELQSLLESLGISNLDLREVVDPDAIVGAIGSVLSGLGNFLSNLFLILMITLFLLGEGPAIAARLRASVGPDNPQLARLTVVARGVIRQLGLRAITNFVIGTGITVLFLVLGVDFPLLWGVLAFFLSFVPYIGLPIAAAPGVLLALAEFGLGRALLAILGVVVINQLAEYGLDPFLLSRGLQLSPAIVFLSFTLWAWLLGAPGAFLAMPITLLLAAMFDTFPETRWLASLMTTRPATDAPPPSGSS